ncbi:MAG: helix-turn-helix transcriptional regulator [bacterium]|nr:helix-turn-helix transcriptional regulator [bacterium]
MNFEMDMDKKQIGSRIRKLRVDSGVKQEDLAKLLGVSRAKLSRFETGEIKPTANVLFDLKFIFSTSIDWILAGTRCRRYVPKDYRNTISSLSGDNLETVR